MLVHSSFSRPMGQHDRQKGIVVQVALTSSHRRCSGSKKKTLTGEEEELCYGHVSLPPALQLKGRKRIEVQVALTSSRCSIRKKETLTKGREELCYVRLSLPPASQQKGQEGVEAKVALVSCRGYNRRKGR